MFSFAELPWNATDIERAPRLGDVLDKRDELPWSVVAWSEPNCKGQVTWVATGNTVSDCTELPGKAGSIFVGARGGTRFWFWDKPGYCQWASSGAAPPAGNQMMGYDWEGPESKTTLHCMNHDLYGYIVTKPQK